MNTAKWLRAGGGCVSIGLSVGLMAAENPVAPGDWQWEMLFAPSEQQLEMEARGRVMIYDGFRDVDIEHAMAEEFHRIDRMMFIRVIKTEPEEDSGTKGRGTVQVVDDGC